MLFTFFKIAPLLPKVGQVTLKSYADEALIGGLFLKSNADKALKSDLTKI